MKIKNWFPQEIQECNDYEGRKRALFQQFP